MRGVPGGLTGSALPPLASRVRGRKTRFSRYGPGRKLRKAPGKFPGLVAAEARTF